MQEGRSSNGERHVCKVPVLKHYLPPFKMTEMFLGLIELDFLKGYTL